MGKKYSKLTEKLLNLLEKKEEEISFLKKELETEKKLVNTGDVAEFFGVNRNTIRRWRKKGKMPNPFWHKGDICLWRKKDIEKM